MIPLCVIVGDSTAVGTSAAIAMSGIQCETHARVGSIQEAVSTVVSRSQDGNGCDGRMPSSSAAHTN